MPLLTGLISTLKATMADRAYGGATMIMHVDGTLAPGAPPLPEYIKANVYIPPPILDENLTPPSSIARVVQQFIEDVGVPAAIRWKSAASLMWKFKDGGQSAPPPKNPDSPLIPLPVTDTSSHRIFFGRPFGSLQDDTSLSCRASSPSSPLSSPSLPPSSPSYNNLHEEIVFLMAQNMESQATISSLRDEIKLLNLNLSITMSELGALRKAKGKGKGKEGVPSSPPTFQLPSNALSRPGSPSKMPQVDPSVSSMSSVSSMNFTMYPEYTPQTPKGEVPLSRTMASSPRILMHRPIKSFGPASADAIEAHGLSHQVHVTLYQICNEYTVEAWYDELLKLYPDRVVTDLVAAMHADVGDF